MVSLPSCNIESDAALLEAVERLAELKKTHKIVLLNVDTDSLDVEHSATTHAEHKDDQQKPETDPERHLAKFKELYDSVAHRAAYRDAHGHGVRLTALPVRTDL